MPAAQDLLIPASYSPLVTKYFARWVRRMFRKSFHAVRLLPEHSDALAELQQSDTPAIVLVSHTSWWDPLISLVLHDHDCRGREPLAPMDATQLVKFGFFKKLGIFGIQPDNPDSLQAMGEYVRGRFTANPRSTLWITPQGRFVDPRDPIELRPGAAALAAKTPNVRVIALAIEYAFWTDQKPEVFLRFEPCATPSRPDSTTAWHREFLRAMAENNARLAEAVRSRDAARFRPALGEIAAGGDSDTGPATNWFYDLWIRLRGQSARVEDRRFGAKR
ncbi:MAG: lysophospholipid acyltransferase family protein [Phycisphaerales bacterium]|nr:lysophospholipid acyltransferase family protein [Phycisphaerales bacterium]